MVICYRIFYLLSSLFKTSSHPTSANGAEDELGIGAGIKSCVGRLKLSSSTIGEGDWLGSVGQAFGKCFEESRKFVIILDSFMLYLVGPVAHSVLALF